MADQELETLLEVVKNGSTFDSLRAAKQVAELARARKKAALAYHPDAMIGIEERLSELSEPEEQAKAEFFNELSAKH